MGSRSSRGVPVPGHARAVACGLVLLAAGLAAVAATLPAPALPAAARRAAPSPSPSPSPAASNPGDLAAMLARAPDPAAWLGGAAVPPVVAQFVDPAAAF